MPRARLARLACALAVLLGSAPSALGAPPRLRVRRFLPPSRGVWASLPPPITQCVERRRETPLDHFAFAPADDGRAATFSQRYFLCDRHASATDPVVFFYAGNEANVELYVNQTGLMWESAARFGAALVFAEHRYYGDSKPTLATSEGEGASGEGASGEGASGEGASRSGAGSGSPPSSSRSASYLAHLTSEQAMADYAELIRELKRDLGAPDAPVIVFGGSYGGMLATWMRLRYPWLVDGAIAGSAPVWAFEGETPPVRTNAFAVGVTYDATEAGGADPRCADLARAAFGTLRAYAEDEDAVAADPTLARETLAALGACEGEEGEDDASDDAATASASILAATLWAQNAFDYLAMGNFPYPSAYILNGVAELPRYPFRVACERLVDVASAGGGEGPGGGPPGMGGKTTAPRPPSPRPPSARAGSTRAALPNTLPMDPRVAASALRAAAGVFYNATGAATCYDFDRGPNDATDEDGELWDWQFCTEMFMPSSRDGVADMFWPQPWNATRESDRCHATWGVRPHASWAQTSFGGRAAFASATSSASNVVWSNGDLDPWSRLGVTRTLSEARALAAGPVKGGAHHLDLMWSRADDIQSVVDARELEREWIRRWIDEKKNATRTGRASDEVRVIYS